MFFIELTITAVPAPNASINSPFLHRYINSSMYIFLYVTLYSPWSRSSYCIIENVLILSLLLLLEGSYLIFKELLPLFHLLDS